MAMQTKYELPKREDEINERTLLAGIGYERQVRYETTLDLSAWLKKGYNFLEIGKCREDSEKSEAIDEAVYAVGIYLCKKILPFEVTAYLPNVEKDKLSERFLHNYKLLMNNFVPSKQIT